MTKKTALIHYKNRYKYQLVQDYEVDLNILPVLTVDSLFIKMSTEGRMIIIKGYAWDGPSGTAFDTKNFMRGSLVHDALYQLIREKHLVPENRTDADNELRRICLEDGMSGIRAWIVFKGVQWFGSPSADPAKDKPVVSAP